MSVRRVAISVTILSATLGCGLRKTPPMALHADLTYPRMGDEVCSNDVGLTSLRVQVTDQLSALLPQVPVYLLPVHLAGSTQDGPLEPVIAYSDETGAATFPRLGTGGRYTVVVAMPGFVPEVRAIEVPRGCSGTLTVVLLVASRERLDALNAGRDIR